MQKCISIMHLVVTHPFTCHYCSSISVNVAIPVDIIIGFPFDAIYSIKGISFISKDATLYADTSIYSKKSTAVLSKGEEKNTNLRLQLSLLILGCHSHGV